MIRELLKNSIKKSIPSSRPLALAFSGGTDSLCILWVCLEIGVIPRLYTYYLKGINSEDLNCARRIKRKYDLDLVEISIPSDVETLKTDVENIILAGVQGKVNIQCMHGHYYLAKFVREKVILNGSGVDGLYGSYKSAAIIGKKDHSKFQRMRLKYLQNPNSDAMRYQNVCYSNYGIQIIFPYCDPTITKYLLSLTWKEMNQPKLKNIIYKEFESEFKSIERIYRPRGSQQIVAGIRTHHDLLLKTNLNKYGRKRVDEIYKDIRKKQTQFTLSETWV